MKIRNGFVSNSSSSSFCIYGQIFDIDEDIEKAMKQKIKEEYYKDEKRDEEDIYISDISEITPAGLMSHQDDYSHDTLYVGRTFHDMKSTETKKKFFARTEKDIEDFVRQFGIKEDIDCSIIDHDYPC